MINNNIVVNYLDEDLVKLSGVMARYIKEVDYEGLNDNLFNSLEMTKAVFLDRFYEVYGDAMGKCRVRFNYEDCTFKVIGLPYYHEVEKEVVK